MKKTLFVTGIGTDVGKTVISALLCEALEADYWKPIQAGDLDNSDTHKIQRWVSNSQTAYHPNSYALTSPMSPDAAADIDNIDIDLESIQRPATQNSLVIEGAGGLLVPVNDKNVIADLIQPEDHVILVCKPYLGSINHTLLSLEFLKSKGITCSLIFNGERNLASERSILTRTQAPVLGHVEFSSHIDADFIKKTAARLKTSLESL